MPVDELQRYLVAYVNQELALSPPIPSRGRALYDVCSNTANLWYGHSLVPWVSPNTAHDVLHTISDPTEGSSVVCELLCMEEGEPRDEAIPYTSLSPDDLVCQCLVGIELSVSILSVSLSLLSLSSFQQTDQ